MLFCVYGCTLSTTSSGLPLNSNDICDLLLDFWSIELDPREIVDADFVGEIEASRADICLRIVIQGPELKRLSSNIMALPEMKSITRANDLTSDADVELQYVLKKIGRFSNSDWRVRECENVAYSNDDFFGWTVDRRKNEMVLYVLRKGVGSQSSFRIETDIELATNYRAS